ncbi:MAG: hypothetical protein ACE5HM_04375 [Acidiferrobacterales bacterium]
MANGNGENGRDKFSAQEVIDAFADSRGIKAAAARKLGCDWTTVDRYCKKYPTVEAARRHEQQELIDEAEANLVAKMRGGDNWAINKVLSLDPERGWVDKQELGGNKGGPIIIKVVYDDDGD